jgi:methyl-accepting chemotaxis protein
LQGSLLSYCSFTFTHDGTEFSVTLSAGIALHEHANTSFDETLINADMKLYYAKENGRNRVAC